MFHGLWHLGNLSPHRSPHLSPVFHMDMNWTDTEHSFFRNSIRSEMWLLPNQPRIVTWLNQSHRVVTVPTRYRNLMEHWKNIGGGLLSCLWIHHSLTVTGHWRWLLQWLATFFSCFVPHPIHGHYWPLHGLLIVWNDAHVSLWISQKYTVLLLAFCKRGGVLPSTPAGKFRTHIEI